MERLNSISILCRQTKKWKGGVGVIYNIIICEHDNENTYKNIIIIYECIKIIEQEVYQRNQIYYNSLCISS